MSLTLSRVENRADRRRFVDFVWDVYRNDPYWVPPLKSEVLDLISPAKNPWFEHARAALWLAKRDGKVVGRISAQVDRLVLEHMGAGLGQWGMFEALDAEAAAALIAIAEGWLREQGMTRSMGPISLSIWDEPGLLIQGFAEPPTVMMGHHRPPYQGWVEAAGYVKAKDLHTFQVDIRKPLGPLVDRLIASGQRDPRLRMRHIDKTQFAAEASTILNLLNDAWSDNWGFVPLTPAEIAYAGKKLKPIIYADLISIVEFEGVAAAFMITIPDVNELTRDLNGRLFPFGWARLLWRLRRPRVKRIRIPLMGVTKPLQGSRMATQMAFMMIEDCRLTATGVYGASHGEFGWVLEDNAGMASIAKLPGSDINKVYRIYEREL